MLVLSRKSRESLAIGCHNGLDHILKVTVLDISRGRVRLGFETDEGFPVHRWELWERIRPGVPQ